MDENGFLFRVASEKKSLWVDETSHFQGEEIFPKEVEFLCPSFACIPLYDDSTFLGIFYIGFSKSRTFSPEETELLLLIAKEMERGIQNDKVRDHEKRVKRLTILWELNKALLTTVNFERIIQMTLTAITIGSGLGFNRAMLFMVNEKEKSLAGTMGVGPDSAEDAGRIWAALSQKRGSTSDLISQLEVPALSNSHLNGLVKGIRVPLGQEQCILSRTVLEGRPFNIQAPRTEEGWLQTLCEQGCHLGSEVGCYVGGQLGREPRDYSFATVPLRGKGKVIGVILVDNLYNRNPVTDEDLHYLSMFSNQAGLAIENTLLYRNLEEVHHELKEAQALLVHHEKMVALGKLSATIAHEIRNPLVSIGGFARRLYRTIPDGAPEKQYTQTIIIGVARVEKVLTDILTYTNEEEAEFEECNLRNILEESLSMASDGFEGGRIGLIKEFPQEVPKMMGDPLQLKHAFFNLISNALQAMNDKGTLSIRLYPITKNGSSYMRVEVKDTGKGIDPENLYNIFNPFYSTKESGLGLGLPIVHKIVTFHRGQIEVDNCLGKGITFIITFPVREKHM